MFKFQIIGNNVVVTDTDYVANRHWPSLRSMDGRIVGNVYTIPARQ